VSYPDSPFQLLQQFAPAGDQPAAIAQLVEGIQDGLSYQTLLGVTGSGKTFTMANVIAQLGRPAIVFAPNKTLAAQLYSEFREFFPKNAVEYFVSYYDYYQPEAYVPQRDLFIEKDSAINEHIEQMRLSATKSLLERRDVIIVASVSAIYGIGNPADYHQMVMTLRVGDKMGQRDVIAQLIRMQYKRNEIDFGRGSFRVRGDTIDVFPAEHSELALRIELFDDEIESLQLLDPLTGRVRQKIPRFTVYPSSHYVTPRERVLAAASTPSSRNCASASTSWSRPASWSRRSAWSNAPASTWRCCRRWATARASRTTRATCRGRAGRPAAHAGGLPAGRRADVPGREPRADRPVRRHVQRRPRAQDHAGGIRLPLAQRAGQPAAEVRGVRGKMRQAVFVSATPADYEKTHAGQVVEQVVRPTGLVDPMVEVRPAGTQVDDVLQEIRDRVQINERVLITTLTKRMAEQLTDYLADNGVKVRYLHSDVDTVERVEILRDLRLGTFDVLVGINLLREGLDLPEVSLVAILDADKEGFLRAERSLIQTIGRAARQPQRAGAAVCRPHHRIDAQGHRRDRASAQQADRAQPGAGHHAAQREQAHPRPDRRRGVGQDRTRGGQRRQGRGRDRGA
jgi:excinuclease ABC subunit B